MGKTTYQLVQDFSHQQYVSFTQSFGKLRIAHLHGECFSRQEDTKAADGEAPSAAKVDTDTPKTDELKAGVNELILPIWVSFPKNRGGFILPPKSSICS